MTKFVMPMKLGLTPCWRHLLQTDGRTQESVIGTCPRRAEMDYDVRCPYCGFDMHDDFRTYHSESIYGGGCTEMTCRRCDKVFRVEVYELYEVTEAEEG